MIFFPSFFFSLMRVTLLEWTKSYEQKYKKVKQKSAIETR